jgi:hypothetical protein
MKLQNKSYIFLLLFFFIGCNASKSTIEYKERIVKDTILQTKIEVLVERFTDTLTIKQPCDSLGNLKPFKQIISTKQGKVSIQGKNNVITAEIDLNAYKQIWESEYKSKIDKNIVIKEKEVVKYRTPLWLIILCTILYALGYLTGKFS